MEQPNRVGAIPMIAAKHVGAADVPREAAMTLPSLTESTPRLDLGLTVTGFFCAVISAHHLLGEQLPEWGLWPHAIFIGAVLLFMLGLVRLVARLFAIPEVFVVPTRGRHGEHATREQ
jgi:hypothetical protein